MSATTRAQATGKIILCGEHAVVYGRPAIALPVTRVGASVEITPGRPETGVVLHAVNLERQYLLDVAPHDDPLALAARTILARLALPDQPDLLIRIRSTIPIASGLGSGAAVATALVRGLAAHFGAPLPPAELSAIVYESEKLLHGTPSGIDNTVIAYEQPIWFRREHPPEPFLVGAPLHLLIADTGVSSPTRQTVGDVRAAWQEDPDTFEAHFDAIGALVAAAREAIQGGDLPALGQLLDRNQGVLEALGVSAPSNEALCEAARAAGALGAKLSGGGRGGNVIALVAPERREAVAAALRAAGALSVIPTALEAQR